MIEIKKIAMAGLFTSAIVLSGHTAFAKGGNQNSAKGGNTGIVSTEVVSSESDSTVSLDLNETTHLIFMREEEKLARDVYTKLGQMYPSATIFGNIDNSEQKHTDQVKQTLEGYGVADPNTNDNIGVFTGEDYGSYFAEKYAELVGRAQTSELEALYVGAFIEELDMLDIVQCPKAIVEIKDDINDVSLCGQIYTDNPDLQQMYTSLLDGSKNHLRAYVGNIEAVTGEGSYVAQVLTQEEVDAILGR